MDGKIILFFWKGKINFFRLSIISDSIHNFTDGIALGVAFSSSLRLGLTTSIAVGAHEIPGEIAEFKILVASGLPISKALLYNFISACVSFIGFFISNFPSFNKFIINK